MLAVGARHAHGGAVAHAAMRRVELPRRQTVARRIAAMGRVSVTEARALLIPIAVVHAPEAAIVVRAVAIGAPAAFLIARIRREVTGTGIGRPLIDVII